MDKRLERIEGKIDEIMVEQAKQHVTLQEHTKRSTMLEEEMKPVRRHVAQMQGAMKLLGILALLAAILEGISAFVR